MFSYIDYEENKPKEHTEEEINNKIKILQEKHYKKIQLEEEELEKIEKLKIQEIENISDIQNDIKLKYENNELDLSDEQIREIKTNKPVIVEINDRKNKYLNLKEYWENYVLWKSERHKDKTGKPYSDNSIKNLKTSYNYLVSYLENNHDYNITNFTSKFFIDLQDEFKKIPSNFIKIRECDNKNIKEIIDLNLNEKDFPRLMNNYINNLFQNYQMFFFYLKNKQIFNNDIFNNFLPLVKQKPLKEWKRFEKNDLELLFNNDYKKGNKQIIIDIIKIGLYSGMRINELSKIRKENIVNVEGIMCFELVEDLENGKSLKNTSSKRIIPIHSEIISIVEKYIYNSKNDYMVWSGSSDRNSDRINEYIRHFIKETDKVFHSTRKNFSYELFKYPNHHLTIKYLMGHSDLKYDQSIQYSNGEIGTIELKKEVIELLKYDL
ncbi:MAG: tyrosine-type recombinase/integrase [Sulfuricurvum sp.]|nr:tyrosine-type recombinase/integrase [Sulfuricurvum sp.]